MAVHCSQRERRAEEAERDVDERFKCAWMSKHVGSEFDGVVTGVTSFGLFVELEESRVSGLVHISQLANDYYHFDPIRKLLKGERSGGQFRLGDHVRVQVLRASLEDRKIDFRLVPSRTPAQPPRTGKAYDYAASGERYSLPKAAPKAAKSQGMFGKAAKAIGRAFGRREAVEPDAQASAAPARGKTAAPPKKVARSYRQPSTPPVNPTRPIKGGRSKPAADAADGKPTGARSGGGKSGTAKGQRAGGRGQARNNAPAPAAGGAAPKKGAGRSRKPKGKA